VTPDMLPGMLIDDLQTDAKGMAARFSDHARERVKGVAQTVGTARILLASENESYPEHIEPAQDDLGLLLRTLNDVTPRELDSWRQCAVGLKQNVKSLVNLLVRYINVDRDLSRIELSTRNCKQSSPSGSRSTRTTPRRSGLPVA
jgi:hypothetical protein